MSHSISGRGPAPSEDELRAALPTARSADPLMPSPSERVEVRRWRTAVCREGGELLNWNWCQDHRCSAEDVEVIEAEPVTALVEAADCVLEAIGWGGMLKLGYSGTSGDVEDFEDALHELLARLEPFNPSSGNAS